MFGELGDQNVFCLRGADDVEVQLLIDVAGCLCAFSEEQKEQVLNTFRLVCGQCLRFLAGACVCVYGDSC